MTFIVTRIVFWGSTKKKNDKLKLCPENRKKNQFPYLNRGHLMCLSVTDSSFPV